MSRRSDPGRLDPGRVGAQLLGLGRLLLDRAEELERAAAELGGIGSALPSGSDGPAVRGGGGSSIVERVAADREREAAAALASALGAAAHAAVELDRAARAILPASRPAQAPAGSGECHACSRPCSGAPNDRLRAGLCNPCRTWVARHLPEHAHDRVAAIRARSAWLDELAAAAGHSDRHLASLEGDR